MFCTKCGANIPDASQFCTSCGNPLSNVAPAPAPAPAEPYVAPAPAPTPAEPYAAPAPAPAPANNPYVAPAPANTPYAAPANNAYAAPASPFATPAAASTTPTGSARQRGLSKAAFLRQEASPAIKKTALATLVIFAVVAVLIVISAFNVGSAEIWDLPIVSMALSEDDIDEMKDELKQSVDELEEAEKYLDEVEKEHGKEKAELAEDLIDVLKETEEHFSINNIIALFEFFDEVDEDMIEDLNLEETVAGLDDEDGLDDVDDILKLARNVIFGFAAFVALIALLAALFKRTGLCILCIILYVPACMLISSTLYGGLIFVALVAMAVTTSRVNKAWKKG